MEVLLQEFHLGFHAKFECLIRAFEKNDETSLFQLICCLFLLFQLMHNLFGAFPSIVFLLQTAKIMTNGF